MSLPTISPTELRQQHAAGAQMDLIDVRTPVEYRELHVEFARNVPLGRLDAAELVRSRAARSGEPLYVICGSGNRSRQACEKIAAAGYTNVVNVEGGTLACADAGLPVVRGKKAISLERQVRIAAGLASPPGCVARLARSSGLLRAIRVRRRRPRLCRHHGHLRNGHAAGPDAVESGRGSRGRLPTDNSLFIKSLPSGGARLGGDGLGDCEPSSNECNSSGRSVAGF